MSRKTLHRVLAMYGDGDAKMEMIHLMEQHIKENLSEGEVTLWIKNLFSMDIQVRYDHLEKWREISQACNRLAAKEELKVDPEKEEYMLARRLFALYEMNGFETKKGERMTYNRAKEVMKKYKDKWNVIWRAEKLHGLVEFGTKWEEKLGTGKYSVLFRVHSQKTSFTFDERTQICHDVCKEKELFNLPHYEFKYAQGCEFIFLEEFIFLYLWYKPNALPGDAFEKVLSDPKHFCTEVYGKTSHKKWLEDKLPGIEYCTPFPLPSHQVYLLLGL